MKKRIAVAVMTRKPRRAYWQLGEKDLLKQVLLWNWDLDPPFDIPAEATEIRIRLWSEVRKRSMAIHRLNEAVVIGVEPDHESWHFTFDGEPCKLCDATLAWLRKYIASGTTVYATVQYRRAPIFLSDTWVTAHKQDQARRSVG